MNNHHHHLNEVGVPFFLIAPFLVALILYLFGVLRSSLLYKKRWPLYRTVFWSLGILLAIISLNGPIASLSHLDFRAHMVSHLLLGMLSPLFMVLAAPMTLLLRTLPVKQARYITRILSSWPVAVIGNPIFTSFMSIGGMYLLYTTNLYGLMQQNMFFHVLVHLHFFIAGYLFSASIIYIDPTPHRRSFVFRSVVLVFTLAAHGILSKYIFAHPPSGVPRHQSEAGGMIMYYGGDAVEVILIIILCSQWYKKARPKDFGSRSLRPSILSNEVEKMM